MYIYNLLETDFANNMYVLIMSDCSKISILGRSIKHVTLVDYAGSLPYLTQRGLVLPCEATAFNLKLFLYIVIRNVWS